MCWLLVSLNSFSETITVKKDGTGDYIIIQIAVDSAKAGDTILVHPGFYGKNLLIQKDITLGSLNMTTNDPAYISQTIISGQKQGSCIRIYNSIVSIWGFTIRNGVEVFIVGDVLFTWILLICVIFI